MSPTPKQGRTAPVSRTVAARNGPKVPLFALGLAALVVLVIGAIVAISLTGDDDGGGSATSGAAAFAPVATEGDALPPLPEGAADPAVGVAAPRLEGETPSGDPITIDPAEGPMVIAFLAHWCPHCQSEVPRLVELADDEGDVDGVEVVAVATSSDPSQAEFPPGEWLEDEDWPGRVMLDSEAPRGVAPDAMAAYGVSGFPFLVAIDGEGNVVARASGEQGDDGLVALFDAARAGGGDAGGTTGERTETG